MTLTGVHELLLGFRAKLGAQLVRGNSDHTDNLRAQEIYRWTTAQKVAFQNRWTKAIGDRLVVKKDLCRVSQRQVVERGNDIK